MTDASTLMLASDDETLLSALPQKLKARGFRVSAKSLAELNEEALRNQPFNSILVDLPDSDGASLPDLDTIRVLNPFIPFVFLIGPNSDTSINSLKGPFAVVHKTDVEGIFLDKLLDILHFFSDRKTPQPKIVPKHPPDVKDLEKFDQRLGSLLQSIQHMAGHETEQEPFYKVILKELSNITSARGGSLFKFEKGMLVLKYSLDPDHVPESISLPLRPASPFSQALSQSKPLLIKDIRGSQGLAHSGWKGYNDGSLMVLPLMDARLNIVSLISLHNKIEPPFNERDLELARLFSSIASQLIFGLPSENREDHYRGILTQAPIGLILFDLDGTVAEVNRSFCDIVGLTAPECLKLNIWDITSEIYRAPEQTLLQELGHLTRSTLFQKYLEVGDRKIKVGCRYTLFKSQQKNLFLASVEVLS